MSEDDKRKQGFHESNLVAQIAWLIDKAERQRVAERIRKVKEYLRKRREAPDE
jgi:hypothetical protein